MTKASLHSWFNGTLGHLEQGAPSIASISFHLGTGVFDGLMAYWNGEKYYLHEVEAHLHRFRLGASRMGLEIPWSVDQLLQAIVGLLDLEAKETQYVRPIAYRRSPELWVTGAEGRPVDVSIFTVRTEDFRDLNTPIACHISPIERVSSLAIPGQIKVSGSYVNSVYARKTAEAAGYADGIMLDREGRIAEASAANVFFINGDRLLTPKLNPDVFPGITREVIARIARKLGIELTEADLSVEDLSNVDGALLCSTLMEIRGIDRLGSRPLGTLNSDTFISLLSEFRNITHQS